MDTLNIPTKRNLLLAKHRLALARSGYDILDKKRQVLIKELASVKKQAGQLWVDLKEALSAAAAVLRIAQAEMGHDRVMAISQNIPCAAAVDICFRGIMGVNLPRISLKCQENNGITVPFDLCKTTVSFDEAVQAWGKAREIIVSWAVIENTTLRLNSQIKKTQKRANALGNITIPMYETRIKYIQERLEERERDELARLKLVKEQSH